MKNEVGVKTESVLINSLQPNEVNSDHLANLFLSPLKIFLLKEKEHFSLYNEHYIESSY